MAKEQSRSDLFVLLPGGETKRAKVPKDVELEGEVALDDKALQVVRVSAEGSAAGNWKALRAEVGRDVQVVPVQESDEGLRYPTGELEVRYRADPEEGAVHALAEEHGLEVVGRSRWQRALVRFRAAGPDTYLPDVIDAIGKRKDVRGAWLSCLQHFRRR
jgi:hypothetical protein